VGALCTSAFWHELCDELFDALFGTSELFDELLRARSST